jgi:hypothetical protein
MIPCESHLGRIEGPKWNRYYFPFVQINIANYNKKLIYKYRKLVLSMEKFLCNEVEKYLYNHSHGNLLLNGLEYV